MPSAAKTITDANLLSSTSGIIMQNGRVSSDIQPRRACRGLFYSPGDGKMQ